MTSPTMEAALRYAALGIAVFPLRPRTKQPYGRTNGKHMATADVDVTRERWLGRKPLPLKPIEELRKAYPKRSDTELSRPVTAGPSANVAIATGKPGRFWVLDEDGPEAVAWVAAHEAEHGPLPDTVEQQTARGRHRCFAWDAAAEAAGIGNRAGLSKAPVDVRGNGGYIVAAPSIHPGDAKKGVPPGFVYRWREGHAPGEIDFAPAPAWLIDLVKPAPEPVAAPAAPRVRVEGRASAYGEAALDRACATIVAAQVGSRDTTLYRSACSIGRLVAGGEIDEAYARSALEAAGRVHVPSVGTEAQLVRQVGRALDWGATRPRAAGERSPARPRRAEGEARQPQAAHRPAPIRSASGTATDARGIWAEADPADVGMVRTWLKLRGLAHEGAWPRRALGRLRAHARAPWNRHGQRGPALLAPLRRPHDDADWGDAPVAVAVLPLAGGPGDRGAERFVHFIGDPAGLACVLDPPRDGALLVTTDLRDAWALACDVDETDEAMGVVVVPTLSAFCGGALGDAWGRVDPAMPRSDPAHPPWMMRGLAQVYLAVRHDLRPPEMKVRKALGGTMRVQLGGAEAARFCGAVAEQAWRRPVEAGGGGANRIRLLAPAGGVDFHTKARR